MNVNVKKDLYEPLLCPICQKRLDPQEKCCICENGHSFDFSKEGYLHLLPSNQMHKKIPGDNPEMVKARHQFLQNGYYEKLQKAICDVAMRYNSQKEVEILDIGCGEGYYTQAVAEAMTQTVNTSIYGIDISKYALKYAAKRFQKRNIPSVMAVASAYHLPFANDSFSVALNIFSPLCCEEIFRVLQPNGFLFYVVPAPKHLWQLKEILYETPYENSDESKEYDGFSLLERISVCDEITLPNQETIQALFSMTPYAFRSPKRGVERLHSLSILRTEISFYIYVYRKS